MNQARVTTRTRNPLVGVFLVGIALILRNVWVWLPRHVRDRACCGVRTLWRERLWLTGLLL